MPKNKKGFTVVEVLCVVTILLIITSFTIPQVWRAIDQAYNVSARFSISTIESVYRLSRTFMLIDSDAPDTPQAMNVDYEVHIPARYEDVQTDYTTYMEKKISDTYGGNPPVYEITEYVTPNGTSRRIRYWPDLPAEKGKCYQLQDGNFSVLTLDAPETHTSALRAQLDELYENAESESESSSGSSSGQ